MTSTLKTLFRVLLISPVLLIGYCAVSQYLLIEGLKEICDAASPGANAREILAAAAEKKYRVRTGGMNNLDEDEWFDREYVRIIRRTRITGNEFSTTSVVFAKPGVGYYACIMHHENNSITKSWFEDNS